MRCLFLIGLCLSVIIFSSVEALTEQKKNIIIEKISKVAPELTIDSIEPAPVSGLLQVTAGAEVFYVSSDGKHLIYGAVLDLAKDKNSWNVTEAYRAKIRKKIIDAVPLEEMIIFKPSARVARIGIVTVFTDLDCGYCRKLHQNIGKINNAGIEVRYLAFPRAGRGSKSYKKAVSVWCNQDPNAMLTLAKNGDNIPNSKCDHNPVLRSFELGRKLGIQGTPTLIFENGTMLSSYVPVAQLVKLVKQNSVNTMQ